MLDSRRSDAPSSSARSSTLTSANAATHLSSWPRAPQEIYRVFDASCSRERTRIHGEPECRDTGEGKTPVPPALLAVVLAVAVPQ